MLKETRIQKTSVRYAIDKGKNPFQPKDINWSYLYLGRAARIQTKSITKIQIFKPNHTGPGKKNKIDNGDNQPPKNKTIVRALISNMFEYSPSEKSANPIAEYSTL